MNETITLLLSAPAVVALVNIAKDLGLPGKFAPVVALGIGVGLAAGGHYAEPGLWQTITDGLLVALAASGTRDLVKANAPSEDRALRKALDNSEN